MYDSSEYQQGSVIPAPPMNPPIPESPQDDFFKFRIDGTDLIEKLEHLLRGEIYDEMGERFISKFEPVGSEEFITRIVALTYSCGINKNVFLGNITKEEIIFKCRLLKKKLALFMVLKSSQYGVKKEMRNFIMAIVINTIHSGLSRSEDGFENNQISVAAQRYEVFNHTPEKKEKGGFLGKIPFLGGR